MPKLKLHPSLVAAYIASTWLIALTALNVISGGHLRTTLLFAVPVAITAWHHWQTGFAFAALAVILAWVGGAMPEPASTSPLWLDALLAFAKLCIDALVAHVWGRRVRARANGKAGIGERPQA